MILISGASSDIGIKTISYFNKRKYKIVTLGRKKFSKFENIFFDIDQAALDKQKLKTYQNKIKIFINYSFSRKSIGTKKNIKSVKEIFTFFKKKKIISINLSTLSVFSLSNYGEEKKKIEKIFINNKGYNIRSGLIYDKKIGGFLKNLIQISKKFRLILLPNFLKKKKIFLTSSRKIIKLNHAIIKNKIYKKKIILVDKKIFTLKEIILKFSKSKIFFFFINDFLFDLILLITEKLKLIKTSSDSLLSLKTIDNLKITKSKYLLKINF